MSSSQVITDKTGHFAWCALVALKLALLDGLSPSEAQQNLFLTRWLAVALKQRRFHRDIAQDIEWLLKQGRLYGVKANLPGKLDYLWRSCSGALSEQSDLFRLTYAFETAKDMQWQYRVLSDREWSGRYAVKFNPLVNAIGILKSSLNAGFDADGRQILPLMVRITGAVAGLQALLNRCDWQAEKVTTDTEPDSLFHLHVQPDID